MSVWERLTRCLLSYFIISRETNVLRCWRLSQWQWKIFLLYRFKDPRLLIFLSREKSFYVDRSHRFLAQSHLMVGQKPAVAMKTPQIWSSQQQPPLIKILFLKLINSTSQKRFFVYEIFFIFSIFHGDVEREIFFFKFFFCVLFMNEIN